MTVFILHIAHLIILNSLPQNGCGYLKSSLQDDSVYFAYCSSDYFKFFAAGSHR